MGEVLLSIAVSWPGNPGRIQQEWLVLGSQLLTTLRDRLYCRTDSDMAALQQSRPSGTPASRQGSSYECMLKCIRRRLAKPEPQREP
jgi:hypothetical protein